MKKGFTLVEMIGVLTLLGLIIGIVYPIYNNTAKNQNEKLYNQIINNLKKSMENYIIVDEVKNDEIILSVEELYNLNYIEEIPTNPITNEKLQGCIKALYKNNNYSYTYSNTCQ